MKKRFLAIASLALLTSFPAFALSPLPNDGIRIEKAQGKRAAQLVWVKADARAALDLRTGKIDLSRDGFVTHDPQLLAEFREEVRKQMTVDEDLSIAVVDSGPVVSALGF